MDTNYKQPTESFITYNTSQTTRGGRAHGKQCGPAPQPGRSQQGQLIWKATSTHGKKTQKK